MVCITKFPSNSHNPQPIHTTLLIMYSYISFSGKQREHSDWWRKIYDLPHSIDGCWQGLRSVKDGALVWIDLGSNDNTGLEDLTTSCHGNEIPLIFRGVEKDFKVRF